MTLPSNGLDVRDDLVRMRPIQAGRKASQLVGGLQGRLQVRQDSILYKGRKFITRRVMNCSFPIAKCLIG